MCGFAGVCWTAKGEAIAAADLQRMLQTLIHRGPDDEGMYLFADSAESGPGVALGHRRLSIIDLAAGHQPLANEDETVWVAFNGEIYNYRELQADLQARGHQFRTNCDTEVIVHLYEEQGIDFVASLRGMFAFALWDDKSKRLLLVRDRLGQKPCFYRVEQDRISFASELKALLQLPGAPRDVDPRAFNEFLTYQYIPHPRTMLQGYRKLSPGHLGIYDARTGDWQTRRYWQPPCDVSTQNQQESTLPSPDVTDRWTAADWQRELRSRLTEAVRLRLRSDVPLGGFLSGGMDSTIIVGLMQQLAESPVHTFAIGFPVAMFDERSYAREAAEFLGTDHHERVVAPEAISMLPRLIWHYDEPFSDSSAIPTMYLSQMTREQVTVALSGDGGDELFAGYDRYRAVALGEKFDRLPGPLRSLITANLWQKLPASVTQKSHRRRLKRLLAGLSLPAERRYLRWISIFDDPHREQLVSADFREQIGDEWDTAGFLLDAYGDCTERDFVTRTSMADVLTYLPCDILTKVDIASMSYSLECRSPFLDHHVAELAARMPMKLKRRGKQGKQILLDTFGDLLPSRIQQRRKMGFGVPLDHWFRKELKPLLYDVVLSERAMSRGYFQADYVRKLVEDHVHGRFDHSYRLWSLLCLEMWHLLYLDPPTPPASCPANW